MPTSIDLAYITLIAVAWPLYEYFVDWPTFQRWLRERPRQARVVEYGRSIGVQWLLVGAGAALRIRAGGSLAGLGLRLPEGWRLWASSAFLLLFAALYAWQLVRLARRPRARARARQRLAAGRLAQLLPRTGAEFAWWAALAVTAGVCEEFLFRGYLLWGLAPWVGWWGAAALGVPVFGLLHAYQGRAGVLATAYVGLVMTLLVAATQSLYSAMALHALVDLGSGTAVWIVLREPAPCADQAEECAAAGATSSS